MIYPIIAILALFFVGCQKPEIKTLKTSAVEAPIIDEAKQAEDEVESPTGNLETVDVNQDGKVDGWIYYASGDTQSSRFVQKRSSDLNFDGIIDVTQFYKDGSVEAEEIDLDYDGKIDVRHEFAAGNPVSTAMDFGFTGRYNLWRYYSQNGLLERKERDTNGDGKVDVWEYFSNGKPGRIGRDLNYDGKIDKWE